MGVRVAPTFIRHKLASILSCSTILRAWPILIVLFTGVSPFILEERQTTQYSQLKHSALQQPHGQDWPRILYPYYLHSPVAIPSLFLSGENGEKMKCFPNPWVLVTKLYKCFKDFQSLSQYVSSNENLSQNEPHPDEIISATCPLKPY